MTKVIDLMAKLAVFRKRVLDYSKPQDFIREILSHIELEIYQKDAFLYDYGKHFLISSEIKILRVTKCSSC